MVVLGTAILSLLIPSAVLARGISHEKFHKRHDKPLVGTSISAPYPTKNSTAPTIQSIASQAVITKVSTINVVPVPVSSPAGGNPPQASSKAAVSSQGAGGNGSPDQCGPATVTVTATANIVTVTASAAGSATSSSAASSSATSSSVAPSATPAKPAEQVNTPTAPDTKPQQPASQQPSQQAKVETPKAEAKNAVQPAQSQTPSVTPQQASPQTATPQTSQAAQSSSTPKKSASSGGKKGLLYANIDNANAMSGLGWGCNWDSSPIPAIGHASGQLSGGALFVPQLWGPEDVHTSIWAGNSKGAEYVMAFNEPNQPQSAGGCGPMAPSAAVAPYEQYLKPNKDAGQKIISPCVSNDAHEWLDTFLSSTSLKPDAVCFHWYGLSLSELKGVVSTFAAIQTKFNIPELWLTEFAVNTDLSTSDAKDLLQWLDSSSGVDRYAYNNNNLQKTPGIQAAYCS